MESNNYSLIKAKEELEQCKKHCTNQLSISLIQEQIEKINKEMDKRKILR